MAKTKENQTSTNVIVLGEVSKEQIEAWKKEHGVVIAIKVKNDDGSTSICYLKVADRNTASLAMSHVANKRTIEAGAVFLSNCWLAGDETIKTVDKKYLAACHQAYDCLDFAEASSEKL
ncbi:hypothetical protein ACR777_05380 [Sphingobacterium spiritivorum]|uniref:hypothetical protein n=1 Tax=Sphingobacterium spiritivorum TaxID=258 RepID=UPI003DA5B742